MEQVILVNDNDEAIGIMEKLKAHEQPTLHRAFSIFLFNKKGEMLLQQRAAVKYHSPLLWTNACCSHPKPGEETLRAAERRLKEELGIQTKLTWTFSFTYQASFENGLHEHEFDHVYVGECNEPIHANEEEVAAIKYLTIEAIKEELAMDPERYTAWFRIALPKLEAFLTQNQVEHITGNT